MRRILTPALYGSVLLTLAGCPGDVTTDDTDDGATTDADGDGFSVEDGDCDDADGAIRPDADEVCDGIDNNCDDVVDEDAIDRATYFRDRDQDTYGDAEVSVEACELPEGYVEDDTDCDDQDERIHPGAEEIWYDGVDSDCAGDSDFDQDGDGYDIDDEGGQDCDDDDAGISPDALEVCDPLDVDENCNGSADDLDATVSAESLLEWFLDADGDGFGDPDTSELACESPTSTTEVTLDLELGNGTRLTDQYAADGVTFQGTHFGIVGGIDNGDPGSWGLNGTNGANFLGFNGSGGYSETATFDRPISFIRLDAARSNGSSSSDGITVQAFAGDTLVSEDSVTFGEINSWSTLEVEGSGITSVTLAGTGSGFHPYGVDNILFEETILFVDNDADCDDGDPLIDDDDC